MATTKKATKRRGRPKGSKNSAPATRKPTVHIAIVMVRGQLISSRSNGDYACFLGTDKTDVTTLALSKAEDWSRFGIYGPYVVGLGTLEEYAVPLKRVPFTTEKV